MEEVCRFVSSPLLLHHVHVPVPDDDGEINGITQYQLHTNVDANGLIEEAHYICDIKNRLFKPRFVFRTFVSIRDRVLLSFS